jgi:hypothetical protein
MTNGMISISPLLHCNSPYQCSNILVSPAYGVYVSQLIRYTRACSTCDQFLVRGSLLTNKLMSQGFQMSRLQAAIRKFYGRYNDLICSYNLSVNICCLKCFIPIVKPFLKHWSWLRFVLFIEFGNRLVWPVSRGCLLLKCTWSHLSYIQRCVYDHSLICISYRT